MTSRRLTAATALLGTLVLASCSDDGGSATTATPARGITSAASSAATESATPSDAFPTTPADLPTRAKDGTVYPGDTWERARPRALGFDPTTFGRDRPAGQAIPDDVPAGRPQGQGRRGVELARHRPRDPARGVLGDEVDHQHAGRHDAGRRRPRHRPAGQAIHRGVARHQVTHGDDPRHPQQRQRPLLGRRQRLRQPAPGRGPHPVRDRPEAAVPARPRLGLQQRGHPDPRPGHLDRDGGAHPRVRRRAAVRPRSA